MSKRRIRIVTDAYNANSLDLTALGGMERTKRIATFSLVGMGAGVAYSLLTRKSVLLGLLVGTLGGMGAGTLVEGIGRNTKKSEEETNKEE